jgi:hypothetical protein
METRKWKMETGSWKLEAKTKRASFHFPVSTTEPGLRPFSIFYFPVSIFQFPVSIFEFLTVREQWATWFLLGG